ncbi:MAG: hypothetical protein ACOYL6_10825 [Bacteriovoracaceae bacterium]
MTPSIKRSKPELQEEIVVLEQRLTKLEKDLRTPLDANYEERASQLENREVLEQLERMAVQRLEQLRKEYNEL